MSLLAVTIFGFKFSGTLAIIIVIAIVVVVAGLYVAMRER